MNTVHYVLTRFNVQWKAEKATPSQDWLRSRMRLFKQYCVPSMMAQTCPPDRWLIYCDASSPDWMRDEMAAALIGMPFVEIVWIPGVYSLKYVQQDVGERLGQLPLRLVTTRIDNDDAFVPSFMAEVRKAASRETLAFINFSHGAQLANGRVYWLSDPANAFLSLAEVLDGSNSPETVWLDQHEKASTYAPVRQLSTRPAWLQVIHGENMENAVRGVRANPGRVLAEFPIDADTVDAPRSELLLDQIRTATSLLMRTMHNPRKLKKLWRVVWPG